MTGELAYAVSPVLIIFPAAALSVGVSLMKGGFHRRFLSDPSRHGHKPVKLHQAGIGVFKKRPVSGAIIVSADAVFCDVLDHSPNYMSSVLSEKLSVLLSASQKRILQVVELMIQQELEACNMQAQVSTTVPNEA